MRLEANWGPSHYARGTNPNHPDNVGLRELMLANVCRNPDRTAFVSPGGMQVRSDTAI